MTLPLLPLGLGLGGVAAGSALHYWLSNAKADPWEDKSVFNARMRDMQSLAQALNDGFSTCKALLNSKPQLTAWRGARDGFSKFYGDTGTLVYSSPSSEQIEQAKAYASKFYFWTGEYTRLKCGGAVAPVNNVDPYNPTPAPLPPVGPPTDWVSVIKWGAIGLGSVFALKTISDLFRDFRRS
jgi:hypothetical protein